MRRVERQYTWSQRNRIGQRGSCSVLQNRIAGDVQRTRAQCSAVGHLQGAGVEAGTTGVGVQAAQRQCAGTEFVQSTGAADRAS